MWTPLTNANQFQKNARLKKTILEGDFQHESIYVITQLIKLVVTIVHIEQNGRQIQSNKQSPTQRYIDGLINDGFKIWIEQ